MGCAVTQGTVPSDWTVNFCRPSLGLSRFGCLVLSFCTGLREKTDNLFGFPMVGSEGETRHKLNVPDPLVLEARKIFSACGIGFESTKIQAIVVFG